MSSGLLLNTQYLRIKPPRDWRNPQHRVRSGTWVALRRRQRPYNDRIKHICAATELQEFANVSTGSLQDREVAAGVAVEVSHVSMAFGDRQVLLLFVSQWLGHLPLSRCAAGSLYQHTSWM